MFENVFLRVSRVVGLLYVSSRFASHIPVLRSCYDMFDSVFKYLLTNTDYFLASVLNLFC